MIPAVIAIGLARVFAESAATRNRVTLGITAAAAAALTVLVGPDLHLANYRFFWEADFVAGMPSRLHKTGADPGHPDLPDHVLVGLLDIICMSRGRIEQIGTPDDL